MKNNLFHIQFTPLASENLENIFAYIQSTLSAPVAATRLMRRIEESIMRLEEHPLSGSLCTDVALKHKGYRKLIIDHYIVFHVVDEEAKRIIVTRVLYGAMDYGRLL